MTTSSCLLFLIFISSAVGCSSNLSVNSDGRFQSKASIEKLDRLSASPGEEVTVIGKNLSDKIEAKVDDAPVSFNLRSDTEATIVMPPALGSGVINVKFSQKSKSINVIPILNTVMVDQLTALTVPPESICETIIFKNAAGKLVRGRGKCRQPASECTQSGQTDCIATKTLPSVTASTLSEKISIGSKIGDVLGKNKIQSADCFNQ